MNRTLFGSKKIIKMLSLVDVNFYFTIVNSKDVDDDKSGGCRNSCTYLNSQFLFIETLLDLLRFDVLGLKLSVDSRNNN